MSDVGVDIAASPDQCYRALCDVERIPEWVAGVAEVTVLERDDRDRASRVRFTSMPSRGSLSYELVYEYEHDARIVRWHTVEVALRDLRGKAQFVELGGGRCRMTYAISNETADRLPGWARAVLDEESAQKVAYAFRRWVER